MKTRHFYLAMIFSIFSTVLSAQEYGKLLYSENECNNPSENEVQNISFKLENEILHITGRIIANCCGNHFMAYEIYSDSIFLSRIDEGELCDCYCLYDINIEIRNCPSNSYKIKLGEYSGNDGIDTTITLSQSSLNKLEGDEIKFYPNPTKDQLIIELPNYKFDRFILYDILGKTVKSIDIINDNILFINIEDLLSGMYIFRLLKTNGITLSEKIIIL